ncbi:hypothetical protein ACNQF7_10325 [Flavobacterium sp. RSP29]|uniref:hypothetical protein n=1 Tax=Flavobacterium sp. RSP29 TaxID=3401731 RepID=UPI003AAD5850
MILKLTYTGSEALEILKTTFPKSWEQEITDGQIFIRSLMRMYQLTDVEAYQKFLNQTGSVEKSISTLAALYVMNCQSKISKQISEIQENQLAYGNQLISLESSKNTSIEDKKTLRSYYISKQNELQQRIENIIFDYPVIGAKRVIVQTNLFKN